MDMRNLARHLSIGRMIIGTAVLVAPTAAGKLWMGNAAASPETRVALRAFAGRDLALGIGTFKAISAGEGTRSWLWASAGSDLVDAVATVLAGSALPGRVRLGLVAVGGGAALIGAGAALDEA